MMTSDLTPESFRQRPDVIQAVENPRSPRSVLNYMCGCDTAKPEIRDSLNQDETVRPLMLIWFQSGRTLDAFCQPFAPVVRELKADPPSLTGHDWDSVEGKVAKVLLADQLSRSCFRGTPEAFSYDPIGRQLVHDLMGQDIARKPSAYRRRCFISCHGPWRIRKPSKTSTAPSSLSTCRSKPTRNSSSSKSATSQPSINTVRY
jgi:hypothetical protein